MTEPNEAPPSLPAFAADSLPLQGLILGQFPSQGLVLGQREKKITRHKFTPEEDEVLRNLVGQFGRDWSIVAQHMPNRTPRQCRDRWKHYISPDVVTGNWTEEEDQLLLQKVEELGNRWSTISQLFPGRTDIGVKNHYISITERKTKDGRDRMLQRVTLLPLHAHDVKMEEVQAEPVGQMDLPSTQAGDDHPTPLPPCSVEVTAQPEPEPVGAQDGVQ